MSWFFVFFLTTTGSNASAASYILKQGESFYSAVATFAHRHRLPVMPVLHKTKELNKDYYSNFEDVGPGDVVTLPDAAIFVLPSKTKAPISKQKTATAPPPEAELPPRPAVVAPKIREKDGQRLYRIGVGETLAEIALKTVIAEDSTIKMPEAISRLQKLNPSIQDKNNLVAGEDLILPTASSTPTKSESQLAP